MFYSKKVIIVGGGLAGSEAAWAAAEAGCSVRLYEMRPVVGTEAHKTDGLAELVCSNSFRGADLGNAVGLLKEEMRRLGSLVMNAAYEARVPAGGALAVDRELFSAVVTSSLSNHPNIEIAREEVCRLPELSDGSLLVIATGPLTSKKLAEDIKRVTGEDSLAFFDAIAPVVFSESIDKSVCFYASRYGKGNGDDYLNVPLSREQYLEFVSDVISAEKVEFKDFEKVDYFEGCLPIEVMAERGIETLRFGPMKPVGLIDERTGKRPYAVVQLRMENRSGSLLGLVGFQTKMKYGEQERVFRKLPGFGSAEFARLGSLHRNTFINTPLVLDSFLRLRSRKEVYFAGQVTGVEGYVESSAIGLMVGRWAYEQACGMVPSLPPPETAIGSLIRYITEANPLTFQPMNINFGLFLPLLNAVGKGNRKMAMAERALVSLDKWIGENSSWKNH